MVLNWEVDHTFAPKGGSLFRESAYGKDKSIDLNFEPAVDPFSAPKGRSLFRDSAYGTKTFFGGLSPSPSTSEFTARLDSQLPSASDFGRELKGRLEDAEKQFEEARREHKREHDRRQAELDANVAQANQMAEDWERKSRKHIEEARSDVYSAASGSPKSMIRLSPRIGLAGGSFGASPPPLSGSAFMNSVANRSRPSLLASSLKPPLGDYIRNGSGSGTHTPLSPAASISIHSAAGLTARVDSSRSGLPKDSSTEGAFNTLFSGSTSTSVRTATPPVVYGSAPAVYASAPAVAPAKGTDSKAAATLPSYSRPANDDQARRERELAAREREEERRSKEANRALDEQRQRILALGRTEAKPAVTPPTSRAAPAPTRNATSDRPATAAATPAAKPAATPAATPAFTPSSRLAELSATNAAKASKPLAPKAEPAGTAAASRAAPKPAAAPVSSRATLGTNPTAERRASRVEMDVTAAKKAMAERIAARGKAG